MPVLYGFAGICGRFSTQEFRQVCVPLVSHHGSLDDSVVTNGSYVAHRQICVLQKPGAVHVSSVLSNAS